MTQRQNSYTYEELIDCGNGITFGEGNAKLPLPPMLMFDRIVSITSDGGKHGKGQIIAELDIRPDLWFFACIPNRCLLMPARRPVVRQLFPLFGHLFFELLTALLGYRNHFGPVFVVRVKLL